MSGRKYLLGVRRDEIRRLEFQETVWGGMSRALWERHGVRSPFQCLDVGAGIGCATVPLARRVLPRGSVVALEPAPGYARILRQRSPRNARIVEASIDDFRWDGPAFDFIFCRWVFLFIHDLEPRVAKLAALLKPGGLLAVEDYHNYHGMALYPETAACARLLRGAQRWFRKHGGDLRVAGRLPEAFRQAGLEVIEFRPNCLAGDARSDVFRWAGLFFLRFAPAMVKSGALTAKDARAFRAQWRAASQNPDAWLVSPFVFDVVGRKAKDAKD